QSFPVLNIGTAGGASCEPSMEAAVHDVAAQQDAYSLVLNGFFKGGYITRNYGAPEARISAVQLELRQDAYLDPALDHALSDNSARTIRDLIVRMMTAFRDRAAEVWG
ncbi:MAG: N-formylglutamate amidohydrolase, partial [Alphaproteobacteria bacterium]